MATKNKKRSSSKSKPKQRKKPRFLSETEIATATRLLGENRTCYEVSKIMGINSMVIYRLRDKLNGKVTASPKKISCKVCASSYYEDQECPTCLAKKAIKVKLEKQRESKQNKKQDYYKWENDLLSRSLEKK